MKDQKGNQRGNDLAAVNLMSSTLAKSGALAASIAALARSPVQTIFALDYS